MPIKNLREGVGATRHGLAAAVAVPDAPGLTANGVATAERAEESISLSSPSSGIASHQSTYQVYRACWVTSRRLTTLRSEAPYLSRS